MIKTNPKSPLEVAGMLVAISMVASDLADQIIHDEERKNRYRKEAECHGTPVRDQSGYRMAHGATGS